MKYDLFKILLLKQNNNNQYDLYKDVLFFSHIYVKYLNKPNCNKKEIKDNSNNFVGICFITYDKKRIHKIIVFAIIFNENCC